MWKIKRRVKNKYYQTILQIYGSDIPRTRNKDRTLNRKLRARQKRIDKNTINSIINE